MTYNIPMNNSIIKAKSRKLKANWTMSINDDLNNMYGINVESNIINGNDKIIIYKDIILRESKFMESTIEVIDKDYNVIRNATKEEIKYFRKVEAVENI
jgi:hypothetical protein